MFGYIPPPDPVATRIAVVARRVDYGTQARAWHEHANVIASVDPRFAARLREVAHALEALTCLAADIARSEGLR
jgi:hypothetical protein